MEAMKNVRGTHVFYLKLFKEFYFVFGIYCKIHSIREISIGKGKHHKKNNFAQYSLLGAQLLRIDLHRLNDILSRNEKMISVDSFSLFLLKEKVDRRVTLATCGICYDICL